MQQLSIFDFPLKPKLEAIQPHDRVKLKLLEEFIDWEIYNYRKYYCDHLIGKVGVVLEVNNNTVYYLRRKPYYVMFVNWSGLRRTTAATVALK